MPIFIKGKTLVMFEGLKMAYVVQKPNSQLLRPPDYLFLGAAAAAIIIPIWLLVAGVSSGNLVANPVFLLALAVGGIGWAYTAIVAVLSRQRSTSQS
jgi:hypothetical protein